MSTRADAGRVRLTRLERALDWAAGLAPAPFEFSTSCCGMSLARGGDALATFGTGPPAVSGREADLLIFAGSLTRRQVGLVEDLYSRMLEPRWVIAWGACAASGGLYDNYATVPGLSEVIPVDVVVPGCPPPLASLAGALEMLRSGRTREAARASRRSADWPILRPDPPARTPGVGAE